MKMKASVLLNVFLATTLLSSMLFSANTAKTGSGSEYDPWIDYNDDGRVDHKDLLRLAATYGTSGDPTKNVNVTNTPIPIIHSTYEWGGLFDVAFTPIWIENETRGFERVTLFFRVDGGRCRIGIYFKTPTPYNLGIESFDLGGVPGEPPEQTYRTIQVQGSAILIKLERVGYYPEVYVSVHMTT